MKRQPDPEGRAMPEGLDDANGVPRALDRLVLRRYDLMLLEYRARRRWAVMPDRTP